METKRVHGGGTDVAHLSSFHYVMQRFQCFLDRCFIIPPMNLVEVHIVGLQPAEALVKFIKDRFARKSLAVRFVSHFAIQLRSDHDCFATDVRFHESSQHFLAGSGGVHVCGVEEIDAQIDRLTKERLALLLV